MRATMLLSATSNGVGVNVRLVGYSMSVSRYQGIYKDVDIYNTRKRYTVIPATATSSLRAPVELLLTC